jgi:hypothetical protein
MLRKHGDTFLHDIVISGGTIREVDAGGLRQDADAPLCRLVRAGR